MNTAHFVRSSLPGGSKILLAALALAVLGGCASVPRDAGFSDVQGLVRDRLPQKVVWNRDSEDDRRAQAAVRDILAHPLSADDAVQVALLNNPGLQATYEELGISQADLVQAGLLQNPLFFWSRLSSDSVRTTSYGVEFNFLSFLVQPTLKKLGSARFEQTKLLVTDRILNLAGDVRSAYFNAIASEQGAAMMKKIALSAEAAAQLAARQYAAGTMSRVNQTAMQIFYAETLADLTRAEAESRADRERLNRLMGLWGTDVAWRLPKRLPDPPATLPPLSHLENLAMERRPDVAAARREAVLMADALGLTRDYRFLNILSVGAETETNTGESRKTGPSVALELPIFDQGQARVARYEAQLRQAGQRLRETAINARSEVREARDRMVTARELAIFQQKAILPLRQKILEETGLFYNGMLKGVYELLEAQRQQMEGGRQYTSAVRDYWVAQTQLERAIGGPLPSTADTAVNTPSPSTDSGAR